MMAKSLRCRIGRHRFLTHHNEDDGTPDYQRCARCGKKRYWGFDDTDKYLIAFGSA